MGKNGLGLIKAALPTNSIPVSYISLSGSEYVYMVWVYAYMI